MKKIISLGCLLLAFACMIGLFMPNVNAADVSQNKKIVSVVYDDSGSMRGENRFVYANYAMQTFCSMLGAEDELYITYMNQKNDPVTIDLSDGSLQNSVDMIRDLATPNGGTPFDSVTKAMDVLRGKKETSERTEFILVVITDGAFTHYETNPEPVRRSFAAFADERMYNGTKPQVIYLGIGNSVTELNLNMSNVREFYADESSPDKNDRIVAKMSEIANVVSGRSTIANANIKATSEKTLEIKSDVPLSNIAALVQGSAGKIVSVTHKETGKKLSVGRSVSSYCEGFSNLSSQSFLITAGKENIPAGTYILTFDQAVSAENVDLMVEPALEIRLSIECNGREIDKLTELDGLREKDLISVSYKIYEYGTDKEVLFSNLPNGTKASLSVYEDGAEKQKVNGSQNTIHHYELSRAKTEFKAVLELPNFNPIEAVINFTPLKYVHYTVKADFGSATQSVKLTEITGKHDLSLVFTLLADGVPVTDPAIVNGFAPKVTTSPNGNEGTTTVRADGKIVFVPTKAPTQGYTNGKMTVTATCTVNGASATANYTVKDPVYEIKAEFGSTTESIKLTEITKPHDLSIVFTVWEDGVQITDKAKIESLIYSVTVSPDTIHAGNTVLTNDGKIIFTPSVANGAGTATVTCTVAGVQKTKTYEVLDPVYEIKAEFGSTTESIKLTEITKPHDLSIIFTVWEDGVQITDKAKIESLIYSVTVSPDTIHAGNTVLTNDGKIIFTPSVANGAGTATVTCTVAGVQKTKTYEVLDPVYEIKAEFGSTTESIKLTEITKPHDLSIIFTVWEDGVQITDKAKIESLIYSVTVSPDTIHAGNTVLTNDGKIIFTPSVANGAGTATVTCTVAGVQKTKTYEVLDPVYEIKAEFGSTTESIKLTEITKPHDLSIIFTVWEDGVQITDKAKIESLIYSVTVSPDTVHDGDTILTDDGKIIFTPHTAKAAGTVTVNCTVAGILKTKTYEILAPVYEVKAEFGSDVREIHLDNIEKDHGLFIIFTVWEDGKQITDKAVLEAIAPVITYSAEGSDGIPVITDDGRILVTPNKAYGKTGGGFYDVIVTCTVGGASASKTYRILLPNIVICPIEPETAIPKHEFYGNTVSVSFYIIKDGKRLTKSEIEVLEPKILNEKYAGILTVSYEIAEDGTVTCTPSDPNEHKVNFFGWFANWAWYWTRPCEDVKILFESNFGSAEGSISVCRAPIGYQIGMAAVPFALELAVLGFFIYWGYCIITKPRFPKNRSIYAGQIFLSENANGTFCHTIMDFRRYPLKKYNTWKYILKPNKKPLEKDIASIHLTATKQGPQCKEIFSMEDIIPCGSGETYGVDQIMISQLPLDIKELSDVNGAEMQEQIFSVPDRELCYLFPQVKTADDRDYMHIAMATIFFYT